MNLEEMFDANYDRVYRFVIFWVQNVQDAEDITSDVFLKAAMNLHRYDGSKSSMSTWLITIALNTVRDFYRTRHEALPLEDIEEPLSQDSLIDSVLKNERARELHAAIGQLDERQREIVLMRYFGEMKNKEIARTLRMTETNVETVLGRAKKRLRNIFEK